MSQENINEILTKKMENPIVLNSEDGIVYKDNPKIDVEHISYDEPILDSRILLKASSKVASANNDVFKLSDAFIGKYADLSKDMLSGIRTARQTRDKSLAAAIITSKDYTLLQDAVVIASQSTQQVVEVGALSSQFEEIGTTTLSGKWRDFVDDLKWYRNIPEGKSPEPSFGSSTETTFSVQKHGGAVAITDRARDVINGADVFARLVNNLQTVRLRDENLMVIEELESNTGNTESGVDFGDRSGTPQTSDQNPLDTINAIIADFGSRPENQWDLFVSKGFIQNEYLANDIVRGVNAGIQAQQNNQGRVLRPVPGFPSQVSWVAEEDLSSSTAGWALNRSAIKKFRGPTRQYTITDPEKEYTKYTTKTHLAVVTVKSDLIYEVTGIAA